MSSECNQCSLRKKFLLTEVEFKIGKTGILIKKKKSGSFGDNIIKNIRGRSDKKMTTDEIMALTRE